MDYLFEDTFDIKDVDPDGKKFDKVSRIRARSENYETDMLLDINIELYPIDVNEKFSLVLTGTLSLDGTADDGIYDQSGKETLADKYDYVMYGKVYKYEPSGVGKVAVCVSYGGLLMRLEGEPRHLQDLSVGSNIYLLMKKN